MSFALPGLRHNRTRYPGVRFAFSAAHPRLAPFAAPRLKNYAALGVSPARLKNDRHVDSKGFAGETPALPGE